MSHLFVHFFFLDLFDTVPVYDARILPKGFAWTEDVFSNLAAHFSLFDPAEFPDSDPELPINSLVAFGFTIQYYYKGFKNNATTRAKGGRVKKQTEPDELCVNLMLQFVLLLGARTV